MADFHHISVTSEGFVAVVELQRPPHNFFDGELIEEIADAFERLDEDPNCRAIVLAAQGKNFCAGANFGGGEQGAGDEGFSGQGFVSTAGKLYRSAARLFANKTPVIGAIQGAAIGGGLGLALAVDFRVVSAETRFSANFVKLGIHQGFGLSVTLPRLVGQQAAAKLLLTGRSIKGEEAVNIGLADILAEPDQIRAHALALAGEIASNAPLAVASVRATLRQGLQQEIIAATERELAEQAWLRDTADAAEGIAAVAARRPAKFSGT